MRIISARHRYFIPLATAGLGLAALGTGVGFALAGHELAILPVDTSSLAMVLALAGTAAFVASVFAFYRVAYADELWVANEETTIEADKISFTYRSISRPIPIGCDIIALSAFAVLVAVSVGIAYGGIHLGVGSLLPSAWSTGASLAMQAGISFIGGAIVGALIISGIMTTQNGNNNSTIDQIKAEPLMIGLSALAIGLLGAAATVAGPALTIAMGITAHTAESMALEALVAISIMSLFGAILKGIEVIDVYRKDIAAKNASLAFQEEGERER